VVYFDLSALGFGNAGGTKGDLVFFAGGICDSLSSSLITMLDLGRFSNSLAGVVFLGVVAFSSSFGDLANSSACCLAVKRYYWLSFKAINALYWSTVSFGRSLRLISAPGVNRAKSSCDERAALRPPWIVRWDEELVRELEANRVERLLHSGWSWLAAGRRNRAGPHISDVVGSFPNLL